MSGDKWRDMGVDAAHEDIAQKAFPRVWARYAFDVKDGGR